MTGTTGYSFLERELPTESQDPLMGYPRDLNIQPNMTSKTNI